MARTWENFIRGLIAREIQSSATSLDEILAPVRRQFEESGMTDAELATLIEEVREDITSGPIGGNHATIRWGSSPSHLTTAARRRGGGGGGARGSRR